MNHVLLTHAHTIPFPDCHCSCQLMPVNHLISCSMIFFFTESRHSAHHFACKNIFIHEKLHERQKEQCDVWSSVIFLYWDAVFRHTIIPRRKRASVCQSILSINVVAGFVHPLKNVVSIFLVSKQPIPWWFVNDRQKICRFL